MGISARTLPFSHARESPYESFCCFILVHGLYILQQKSSTEFSSVEEAGQKHKARSANSLSLPLLRLIFSLLRGPFTNSRSPQANSSDVLTSAFYQNAFQPCDFMVPGRAPARPFSDSCWANKHGPKVRRRPGLSLCGFFEYYNSRSHSFLIEGFFLSEAKCCMEPIV